jgi:N-acetylmuramoyl-L-alanine amidase
MTKNTSANQSGADLTLSYTRIVERYATFFPRPEARLRFFNSTIAKQVARQSKIQKSLVRFTFIEKTPIYRWIMESMLHRSIIEELSRLLPESQDERKKLLEGTKVPLGARFFFWAYRVRYAFYGIGLASVALLLVGLYFGVIWSGQRLNQYLAAKYGSSGNGSAGVIATQIATYLPGYNPDKVWRVEVKDGYELYSNGARINLEFETDNHPRNYILYSKDDPRIELKIPVQHQPVGIIYHTTEGELVGFTPDNNESLQRHSHGMLSWVKQEKSYNYVIDRFGQINRIVRDEQAANHAGHSIWSDDKYMYVSLNESFIGVSFETRQDAKEDQLTEAQLVSGRNLTGILRSKYNIRDENCTTHGLVSISPAKMLIAYHNDWIHNFPFVAMGVSDKYSVPPPSVAKYGCGWDDVIMEKVGGKLWAGVNTGQSQFEKYAETSDVSADTLRKEMKELYQTQLETIRNLRDKNTVAETSEPSSDGVQGKSKTGTSGQNSGR